MMPEYLADRFGCLKVKGNTLERFVGVLGVFALMAIAYAISNNRRAINWHTVTVGVGLQVIFALIVLKTTPGQWLFQGARLLIVKLLTFADYGAYFIFSGLYLCNPEIAESLKSEIPPGGLTQGFQVWDPLKESFISLGTIFGLHVLPTIIFFASLMGILYYLGIMQLIIKGLAWVMKSTMNTGGAESLSVAGNIFVGQTEAPFLVRPFLARMTNSELMAVMTGGFATVAGGVMAAYVRFGIDAGHLMAASVMSAPAALVMAKLVIPEVDKVETTGLITSEIGKTSANILDAAAGGASDGLKLAVNVAAMLIAFIALIAMLNWFLSLIGGLVGVEHLSLKMILGYLFSPIAFLLGIQPKEVLEVGFLLGTKISINEFVAYVDLASLKEQLSPRSFIIATYALCGFANFGSIAIQIGGISALVPSRRNDLARLGLRAMIAGALASWQTAAIAGILL